MLRATDHDRRPAGRDGGERGQVLQAVFARSQRRQVRIERLGGAEVKADGVDADADDVPLVDQQRRRVRMEAGEVRHPGGILVEERRGVDQPRLPARVHRDESAGRQRTVPVLPSQDVVRR